MWLTTKMKILEDLQLSLLSLMELKVHRDSKFGVNIGNSPTYTVECFDSTKCTKDNNYDYKFDVEEVVDLFKVYLEDLDGTPFELLYPGSCYFDDNKQVAYSVQMKVIIT